MELAAQEAVATKERLATRTAAASLFSGAVARVDEAKPPGSGPGRSSARQAEAVEDLLGSGMQLGEWRSCWGFSKKELRSLRVAMRERPTKARRADERVGATIPITDSTPSCKWPGVDRSWLALASADNFAVTAGRHHGRDDRRAPPRRSVPR